MRMVIRGVILLMDGVSMKYISDLAIFSFVGKNNIA